MNRRTFKRRRIIINRFIVASVIGLIIGSFFDLAINNALYARGTIIPNFFRLTGEMPMILILLAVSIESLRRIVYSTKDIKQLKISTKLILILVAILLPTYVSANGIPEYFDIYNNYAVFSLIFFYLLTGSILSFLFRNYSDEDLDRFFKFIVIVVLITMMSMNILKRLWGRARYQTMYVKNDFTEFSFWMVPQFRPQITDLYKSFPSGHTTSAAVTLVLLFLPKANIAISKQKWINIFAISWPILVAISRILDGAHFLTDVSAGMLLTSIIIIFSLKFITNHDHQLSWWFEQPL